MSAGLYHYANHFTARTRSGILTQAAKGSQLLFYKEGLSSVVTVGQRLDDEAIWLAINGKTDASTGGDMQTQVLLGHIPVVFRPQAGRVLVIGLGGGVSAGAVTLHSAPRRIDIVELETAVVTASHYFDQHNHRPLEDPRVHMYANDARNHLVLSPDGSYDLILVGSDAPLPMHRSTISDLLKRQPAVAADLQRVDIGEPEDLLARYLNGRDNIRTIAGNAMLNTDDNILIEYAAPLHLYEDTRPANLRLLRSRAELPLTAVDGRQGRKALFEAYARRGDKLRAKLAPKFIDTHPRPNHRADHQSAQRAVKKRIAPNARLCP